MRIKLASDADALLYQIYLTIIDKGLKPAKTAIATYIGIVGSSHAENLLGFIESFPTNSTHITDDSMAPFVVDAEKRANKLAIKLF